MKKINQLSGEIKIDIKVKGVTLDRATSQLVTHERLVDMAKDLLDQEPSSPIRTTRDQFRKTLGTVRTVTQEKWVRPVMDKIILMDDGSVRPFGYVNVRLVEISG